MSRQAVSTSYQHLRGRGYAREAAPGTASSPPGRASSVRHRPAGHEGDVKISSNRLLRGGLEVRVRAKGRTGTARPGLPSGLSATGAGRARGSEGTDQEGPSRVGRIHRGGGYGSRLFRCPACPRKGASPAHEGTRGDSGPLATSRCGQRSTIPGARRGPPRAARRARRRPERHAAGHGTNPFLAVIAIRPPGGRGVPPDGMWPQSWAIGQCRQVSAVKLAPSAAFPGSGLPGARCALPRQRAETLQFAETKHVSRVFSFRLEQSFQDYF
jgi:hypothetical protein